jgi:phosphatidylserine decarboxylase
MFLFFRDPERFPDGDGILSPADGRVMDVSGRRVSIFMNLHDVHVQRAPLDGEVKMIEYKKGSHTVAFRADGDRNESNTMHIGTAYGNMQVVQIAGLLARRIKCHVSEGDRIQRGQRIGKIRFGSRVDATIPDPFKITVKKGDKVLAGKSVIATLD